MERFHARRGFPVAKILGDDVHHVVGRDVSAEADGHVVGHVVFAEVVLDVGYRRVFQVLLRADDRLLSVGVVGVEHLVECLKHFPDILGEAAVVFLIDSLQLGVESSDDHVLEAVALHGSPALHLVGGDVLNVARLVLTRECIASGGADACHELVVLVGDGDSRCLVGYGVDGVVDVRSLLRVGCLPVSFVESLDFVEHGLFRDVILGSELRCSLEHDVFEVVGESGGLSRVVLSAGSHGDGGLDSGLVVVDHEIDAESIVERADFHVPRVAFNALIVVFVGSEGDGVVLGAEVKGNCPK